MNTIAIPPVVKTYHVVRPKFDVLYPFVEGIANPHVQHEINQRLTHEMHAAFAAQSPPDQAPMQTDITAGYEIKNNQRGILSITLIIYTYSGGAHGITVRRSLTFDVTTGREYTLGALFKPDSNWMERIDAIIRAQIAARQMPLISEFTGVKPDQPFYIADKSLVVYFQLYDLLPYAYGFPYFPISVYELEGLYPDDGPLGRMLP